MWPYMIHFRSRTLAYVAVIFILVYLWHYMFNLQDARLRSYHMSYVNFKHLLIACVLAAQKGGFEVKKARQLSDLKINVKGKTKEGIIDLLTIGDKKSNVVMVNSLLYTIPGIKIISEENIQNDDFIELLNVDKYLKSPEYSTIPDDIELNIDDLTIWIDPLDATKEYSEGLTHFVTTMVCVARHGQPIIGVIHQPFVSKTYWASKFGIDKKLLSSKFTKSKSVRQDANDHKLRIIISRSHKGDIEQWLQNNSKLANVTLIEAAGSGFKTLQLLEDNADIYLHKTYIKKWDICAPNVLLKYASEGIMTNFKGEKIDYSFQSEVVNRDGVFATANPKLVRWQNVMIVH